LWSSDQICLTPQTVDDIMNRYGTVQ
jgi:hypothetical protein